MIGGKYLSKKSYNIVVLLPMLHRDASVWGERAEAFDPDNFARDAERARPANAYKPFGNGQRACIGRQFALQEAALVLGMILQRFKLLDPHRYQLKLKETLTIKPDGFHIRVRSRAARDRIAVAANGVAAMAEVAAPAVAHGAAAAPAAVGQHGTPALVLYGSNLGTAEELARRIAQDAEANGFATAVAPLDAHAGRLPREGVVLIASASYNGTPPDNAVKFCEWLGGLPPDALRGVTLLRVRLRQPRLGGDVPGRAAADRRARSPPPAPAACTRAARATRATTSTASSSRGTRRSGRRSCASSRSTPRCPSRRRGRTSTRSRWCRASG